MKWFVARARTTHAVDQLAADSARTLPLGQSVDLPGPREALRRELNVMPLLLVA